MIPAALISIAAGLVSGWLAYHAIVWLIDKGLPAYRARRDRAILARNKSYRTGRDAKGRFVSRKAIMTEMLKGGR